jgi:hypothetical protein
MKHEIVKTIEEMDEVTHCMYCGSKLDSIDGKNEKICPNDCLRMKFVKIGDPVPEALKKITDKKKVDEPLHFDIGHCTGDMIS